MPNAFSRLLLQTGEERFGINDSIPDEHSSYSSSPHTGPREQTRNNVALIVDTVIGNSYYHPPLAPSPPITVEAVASEPF